MTHTMPLFFVVFCGLLSLFCVSGGFFKLAGIVFVCFGGGFFYVLTINIRYMFQLFKDSENKFAVAM